MSPPDFAILVFGDDSAVRAVCGALPPGQPSEGVVVHHMPANAFGWQSQGEPLILLGIGPAGCASLAAHVAGRGLDGVRAVVLVESSAPWAERTKKQSCPACGFPGCDGPGCTCPCHPRIPLGPIEPLRAVAERAREGERCSTCNGAGDIPFGSGDRCQVCDPDGGDGDGRGRVYPLRLVLAACPEAPTCEACATWPSHLRWGCATCSGTGRMLSSAEVARELGWEPLANLPQIVDGCHAFTTGGLSALSYPTRTALLEHGLEAALRVALEGSP